MPLPLPSLNLVIRFATTRRRVTIQVCSSATYKRVATAWQQRQRLAAADPMKSSTRTWTTRTATRFQMSQPQCGYRTDRCLSAWRELRTWRRLTCSCRWSTSFSYYHSQIRAFTRRWPPFHRCKARSTTTTICHHRVATELTISNIALASLKQTARQAHWSTTTPQSSLWQTWKLCSHSAWSSSIRICSQMLSLAKLSPITHTQSIQVSFYISKKIELTNRLE